MGVGGARGRLIEFGERERRAQFEAARALSFGDGDCGLERFLGSRRVAGIALEQHFATDAVQFRVKGAMTNAFGRRQRFVEDGESAVGVAREGFGFSQSNHDETIEHQDVLLAQEFGVAAHVCESAAGRLRPPLEEDGERSPGRQIMLTRKPDDFDGVRRCA